MKVLEDLYLYFAFNKRNILFYILVFAPSFIFLLLVILKEVTSLKSVSSTPDPEVITSEVSVNSDSSSIKVYISGAVKNPGVYLMEQSSRVVDLLSKAGGLSYFSSSDFIMKNLNLSKKLKDEEKYYIPFEWDLKEDTEILISSFPTPESETTTTDGSTTTGKVNVNTATVKELDSLPGIGATYAKKIYDNRPYTDISELKEKAELTASIIQKIENLIAF